MRARAALLAIAGAAALAPAAAATPPPKVVLTLVDPATTLTQEPPLTLGAVRGEVEGAIFRQRVDTKERVLVGVDAEGKPVSIAVDQRLRVIGKGDYLYTVPGPVLSVAPTPDSESAPGQRQGAILWAGFSPGVRRLGAHATLAPKHIESLLPLRVSIEMLVNGAPLKPGERRSGDVQLTVTLTNATATRAPNATANGDRAILAGALDAARRGEYAVGGVSVGVTGRVRSRISRIEAPLAVRGEVTFATGHLTGGWTGSPPLTGGKTLRFTTLLGDGRPLTRTVVSFSGRGVDLGPPKLRLVADPVNPQRTLVPPRGKTWAEAIRLDPGLDSTSLLTTAEDAYLRAARAHQYRTFLADPGPVGGVNTGDYLYVSAAPRAAPAPPPTSGGGLGALGLGLAIVGGLVVAGGLAVGWAYL